MQFEQVPYEVKAHTTGAFGLFSRVLVLFFAAAHSAKNVGGGNGAELATYVVEKGKPLITLEK
jgi:hypothetical protein